jgi:DNA-binding transcriptional MerR regulator
MAAPDKLWRIKEVAQRTGLTERTLRYYEEIGLAVPTARTQGNYRLYSEADIARLERICQIKSSLGLSLAETIAMLEAEDERLTLREAYRQATDPAEQIEQLARAEEVVRGQLALVESKLHTVAAMRDELRARLERCAQLRARILAEAGESVSDEA